MATYDRELTKTVLIFNGKNIGQSDFVSNSKLKASPTKHICNIAEQQKTHHKVDFHSLCFILTKLIDLMYTLMTITFNVCEGATKSQDYMTMTNTR